MASNGESAEKNDDLDDILRCSYENTVAVGGREGTTPRQYNMTGQVEEISEFGEHEDEFADILLCSYERAASVDYNVEDRIRSGNRKGWYNKEDDATRARDVGVEKEGGMNRRYSEPATAATAPSSAAVSLQHHEKAIDSTPHSQDGGKMNDSVPTNSINFLGPARLGEQQPQQMHQVKCLPSPTIDFEQDRSILSQIHLLSHNGADDLSSLPNDDLIYDRGHGISKLKGMLRNAADLIEGVHDVDDTLEAGVDYDDIVSSKKKGRNHDGTDGGNQYDLEQKRRVSGSDGSTPQNLPLGTVSRQTSENIFGPATVAKEGKEKDITLDQKEATQAKVVQRRASDEHSSDSKKSLYAAVLARRRMEHQSQCSAGSADSKSVRRVDDENDKAPQSAPVASSIAPASLIVHSISGVDVESTLAPSSIQKSKSNNMTSPESEMPIEDMKPSQVNSHGKSSNGDHIPVAKDSQENIPNQDNLDGTRSEGININNLEEFQNPQDGTGIASMSSPSHSMKVIASIILSNSPSMEGMGSGGGNISRNNNNLDDADSKPSSQAISAVSEEQDATSCDKEDNKNDSSAKEMHNAKPPPSSIDDELEEQQQQIFIPSDVTPENIQELPVSSIYEPLVNSRELNEVVDLDTSYKTDVISNTSPSKSQGRPDSLHQASTKMKRITQQSFSSAEDTASLGSNISNLYSQDSMPLAEDNVGGAKSASSASQPQNEPQQYNGWNVPLGVHKIVCSAPGLIVTTQVHRRSSPVRVGSTDLIIPPGSYVEVLETRLHGKRVRGRICWELEEIEEGSEPIHDGKKSSKKKMGKISRRTSKLINKKRNKRPSETDEDRKIIKSYEGWISLQWANSSIEQNGIVGASDSVENDLSYYSGIVENTSMEERLTHTDEDSGPWSEAVPLGVYRINPGRGPVALHANLEPNSAFLGKLRQGRCIEVVQTQVKYDGVVRARVFVPNCGPMLSQYSHEEEDNGRQAKFKSGWIDLLNTSFSTGAAAASPVPLGAYIVVADEPGCVITEGGQLDSRVKGTLGPGSCMEVVATRLEESGVVRGLIAGGGHVTLLIPPHDSSKVVSFDDLDGRRNANIDEGQMLAMPVPTGTYRIVEDGISVSAGMNSSSMYPGAMELPLNSTVEIIETHAVSIEDSTDNNRSRVRGRIIRGVIPNKHGHGGRDAPSGWMTLFEVRHNQMRMYAHPQKQPRQQQI